MGRSGGGESRANKAEKRRVRSPVGSEHGCW